MGRHKLKVIEKQNQRLPQPPVTGAIRATRSNCRIDDEDLPTFAKIKKPKRNLSSPSHADPLRSVLHSSSSANSLATQATSNTTNSASASAAKNKEEDDNRNALEKIIKIDKKHTNFEIYDTYANHLLKVRSVNYQINYQQIQGLSQTDHSMRQFWRHINSSYMRKVTIQDEDKLEYFKNFINQPIDSNSEVEIEWEDYNVQIAILRVLDKSTQRLFPEDDVISQLNYSNLLMHIRISFLIANKFITEKTAITKYLALKRKSIQPVTELSSDEIQAQMERERDTLKEICAEILDRSSLAQDIANDFDELAEETNKLIASLKTVNNQNAIAIHKLEDQMKLELDKGQMVFLETSVGGNSRWGTTTTKTTTANLNDPLENKRLIMQQNIEKLDHIEVQKDFLFKTILRLEKLQLAETVTCVTGFTKKEKSTCKFEVRFEQAYNENPEWMHETLLDSLNVLREQNLFAFYNIPQKTLYSHIANNFLGYNHIQKTRTKLNTLKQNNLKELITKKDALANRMEDSDSCHHCKHFFQDSILIQCNYNAATMGLPLHDYVVTDPFLFEQMEQDNPSTKKPQVNRKRNCYTTFQRVDGELVCKRKYCRSCLKQNYDLILADIKDKPDWVCPFCQGNCYCTRCLRNELIMKYKGIYTLLGGDVNLIAKESVFEYYSQSQSYSRRREQQEMQVNIAKGIKGQSKGLRLKEEKQYKIAESIRIRSLSQQMYKREKFKFELVKHDIETFREKYAILTGKEFTQIDPAQYTYTPPSGVLSSSSNKIYSKKNQHLARDIESESATLTLDSMINPKSNKLKLIQMSNIFKKKKSAEEDDFEDEVEEEGTEEQFEKQEKRKYKKKPKKYKKIKKELSKYMIKKQLGLLGVPSSLKKKKKKKNKLEVVKLKKKKNLIRKTRSQTSSVVNNSYKKQ